MRDGVTIQVDSRSLASSVQTIHRLQKAVSDDDWWRKTHRARLRPIATAMKANSKSSRIADMIGVTTAKSKTLPKGAKVGVIRNSPARFPKITAQALASLIEYGSKSERFRGKGFITVASTGVMPAAPFLRPAWDTGKGSYIRGVEQDVTAKVEKEAGRE